MPIQGWGNQQLEVGEVVNIPVRILHAVRDIGNGNHTVNCETYYTIPGTTTRVTFNDLNPAFLTKRQ